MAGVDRMKKRRERGVWDGSSSSLLVAAGLAATHVSTKARATTSAPRTVSATGPPASRAIMIGPSSRIDSVQHADRLFRAVVGFLAAGMGVGLLVGAVFGVESVASRLAYLLAAP